MKKIEKLEDLKTAINSIDWQEIHIDRLKYDHGNQLYLYYDDENDVVEVELFSKSTYPGAEDRAFAIFNCDLEINSTYSEGWAERDNDTGNYKTEKGKILSEIDMAVECIQYGDFSDTYEVWKQEIIDDFINQMEVVS